MADSFDGKTGSGGGIKDVAAATGTSAPAGPEISDENSMVTLVNAYTGPFGERSFVGNDGAEVKFREGIVIVGTASYQCTVDKDFPLKAFTLYPSLVAVPRAVRGMGGGTEVRFKIMREGS